MDWPLALLVIFGGLLLIMATGMPVAFGFALINVLGIFFLWGGGAGLRQLTLSVYESLTSFILLPIPLFILMGDVVFHSGIGNVMLDAIDKWMGRIPGRLGILAIAGGTLLSTLTGASVASVAILGSTLVPEMERRGYKKPMSLGPILGSGGLAFMIPPSGLAVWIGAIGMISIGSILIAIILPGILMAFLYGSYIIIRCKLQPNLAPEYAVDLPSMSEKLRSLAKHVLPLGIIIFLVVGVIFIGVATPSEAAATGALGCFCLAAAYRKLNW
ncbi:TRAP transporter large permease subunit, partial [Chloroflexota bacterium]